jgi:serine/threonine protein kinase
MESGSSSAKEFISSALKKEPESRMTSKMMLEHPFISKYIEIETCEEICKMTAEKGKRTERKKIK